MSPAKKKASTFKSFQVISKKAQKLLEQAAKRRRDAKRREETKTVRATRKKEDPALEIQFSAASVGVATVVVIGVLLGAWLVYAVLDTIILLLLAFFLAAILDPTVHRMEQWGVPRGLAILVHLLAAVLVLLFLSISFIPLIATQLQQIAVSLSNWANAFIQNPEISLPFLTEEFNLRLTELVRSSLESLSITKFTDTLRTLGENLSPIAQGSVVLATRIAGSVLGFIINLFIVLALSFFMLLEKESIRGWFSGFFSATSTNYIDHKADLIQAKISQWVRGQLILGFVVGSLVFIALTILRFDYAATLALLAFMTEFVPYIGPFIAAAPAVLIALSEGGFIWALIIMGVYYMIQWCENNLLVPLIMKRAVGVSSTAIMFAMLVGVSFPAIIHPILGLLLAVPVTTIISIFLDDWRSSRQRIR